MSMSDPRPRLMLTDHLTSIIASRKAFAGMQPSPPPPSKYVCFEEYVLENGTPFVSAPLTPEELSNVTAAVKKFGLQNAVVQECFYNAQMIATYDDTRTLLYTEGYASGAEPFPVLHGWLTINSKVIDVTWRKDKKAKLTSCVLGELPPHWEYIGRTFDTVDVMIRILGNGETSPFIDDWKGRYPLLQR